MNNFFNSDNLLAKLIFLVLAIIAVHYHIIAGVIVVLIFISFTQNVIEGMEDMNSHEEDDSSKLSNNVQTFKETNCVNGSLMKDGNNITPQEVINNFPNLKFSGDTCNPCDEDCKFEIISTKEQLSNEENLRSIDSNQINVKRDDAIKQK